ncbi:MAG: tetratricopeptide repeat protein, partial [Nitrospinales bacterium]
KTILKVQPDNDEIRNAVGFLFMEMNQWRRAIPHLTASLKSAPDQNPVRLRLGKAHQKIGQTDLAVDLFKQALKIQPHSWEALIHLAHAYETLGRRHLTVSLFKKYLASYPGSLNDEKREWIAVNLSTLYARQGDELYRRSRFKKAEAAYKQALNWKPGNKTILQNLGWAMEKQGKYDEAVKAWLKIVDQGYTGFQLFHQIANAYYHSVQRDQAEVWYQNTGGIDPSNENIQFRLFELAMEKKEIPNALIALQHAFVSDKADPVWSMTAANHFIRNGNIERGVEFFLQRLSHSSSSEMTKKALGRLYVKMGAREREVGHVRKAMWNYEKALFYDAFNAPAYRDLGWLYRHAEKKKESERIWKQYQKNFPDKAEPHNLLARFYLNQGDYEKSLAAIKRSLKIDPHQPGQELLQAKALYWNKQYPEAMEKMNRIVREYPDHLPIQYFYGEVLMRYQDFKRGGKQWKKVLDMGAKNPRAYFYWIQSLYETGEYEKAVKAAQIFLDQHTPYKPVIKLLADDALFRQDKQQAVFWHQKLLKDFRDNPGDWLELAKLYEEMDHTAQATDCLKEAERKFPDDVEVQVAIGDLKLKEGKYEEALGVFNHIRRINPDNRRAFIGTFHALKAIGRLEEAIWH